MPIIPMGSIDPPRIEAMAGIMHMGHIPWPIMPRPIIDG
jgi:hypothetical protein